MEEKRKKESGWPIEDDELDNVSGGFRPAVAKESSCPKCHYLSNYYGTIYECRKCGCRWNSITGEILN